MATSTMSTFVFSFGLRLCTPQTQRRSIQTVQFTPSFAKKQSSSSINLSSTRSISGFPPLVLSKNVATATPQETNSHSMTVVCAKGYKMKTHKASAKRFRVSGTGKILRRRAGKQHLLRKKNAKRRCRLSKTVQVDRSDYNNVIGALPYLKVNRSN